jgi:hypothetical protein
VHLAILWLHLQGIYIHVITKATRTHPGTGVVKLQQTSSFIVAHLQNPGRRDLVAILGWLCALPLRIAAA